MRNLLLVMMLSLASMFTSCDDGSDPIAPQETITDYDKSELNQSVYADETEINGDFTFTAANAWHTIIESKTKVNDTSWVTIDPARGDAGTIDMSITLEPNTTGEERSATIKIVCKKTTIAITIEQKATTESEEKPAISLFLKDFSATNIPDVDRWIINDTEATTDSFKGLRAALNELNIAEERRIIDIEFPNLKSFPYCAMFYGYDLATEVGDYDDEYQLQVDKSISAPLAIEVGEYAFAEFSLLASVELPLVTLFDNWSLCGSHSLKSIDIPRVKYIGEGAFTESGIKELSAPVLSTIGEWAFSNSNIETVSMPELATIENNAFYESKISKGDFSSVITIGDSAFEKCRFTEIEFTEAKVVGDLAFARNESLITIHLPKAETFKDRVFSGCVNLEFNDQYTESSGFDISETNIEPYKKFLQFPKLTSMGSCVFAECYSIYAVRLPVLQTIEGIFTDDYFGREEQEKYILYAVDMPTIKIIPDNTFYGCPLERIYAPMATTIGCKAFSYSGVKFINQKDFANVTLIKDNAFCECFYLYSAVFPKVITVGDINDYRDTPPADGSYQPHNPKSSVFYDCRELRQVVLLDVKSIGYATFSYCENLYDLVLPATPPTIGQDIFFENNSNISSYVPSGAKNKYNVSPWNNSDEFTLATWDDTEWR